MGMRKGFIILAKPNNTWEWVTMRTLTKMKKKYYPYAEFKYFAENNQDRKDFRKKSKELESLMRPFADTKFMNKELVKSAVKKFEELGLKYDISSNWWDENLKRFSKDISWE